MNKIFFLVLSFLLLSTMVVAQEGTKQTVQNKKSTDNSKKKTESAKKKSKKKKVYYYPKAKKPVALRQENYQKINMSLKGLKGVYINLDPYISASKKRKMKIGFDMKKKVITILKKHNIKLLTKDEIKGKFGQPTIKISTSFPAYLGPYKKDQKKKKPAACCAASVSASLTEGAVVLRKPNLNMLLTTWKTAQRTGNCTKLDEWFPKAVIKVVEKFVSDKAKVEKKKVVKKKPAIQKKPVIKKEKVAQKKPVVIKKPIIKKVVKEAHKYSLKNRVINQEVKKVIKKKVVKKQVKVVKKKEQTHTNRAYVVPHKTAAVTQRIAPVVQTIAPVVFKEVATTQKVVSVAPTLSCSNNEFVPSSVIMGEGELYRKVVTYERVGSRQQVVNYEVVVPQKTMVIQEPIVESRCAKVDIMEMEIFRTGSSIILSSQYFVLDGLVSKIESCGNYFYVIETHADQRGSHLYNDRLTRDRASSIASYLRSRGISSNRFEIQSFGKRRPIKLGTSLEDYSKNRRVVVIPHRMKIK